MISKFCCVFIQAEHLTMKTVKINTFCTETSESWKWCQDFNMKKVEIQKTVEEDFPVPSLVKTAGPPY